MKQEKINKLNTEWTDCTKCTLSQIKEKVVFGHGNPDAKIVMVGETPVEDETERLFDRLLSAVGISRDEMWFTNTLLCRPKPTGTKSRIPRAKEIKACSARLIKEIEIINPEIVVLAGNVPLYMATKKRGITKNRGWIVRQGDAGPAGTTFSLGMYATLHPASLLHGSKEQKAMKGEWLLEDWLQIAEAFLGKEREESWNQ